MRARDITLRRPELVMPAGALEKLHVACAYGADAVYAGMPQFSLRARTNSFTVEHLAEGIAYAHNRGVRVYLTLNIFARNQRIEPSIAALRELRPYQPDAVIMSDPGLIMLTRQECPDLDIHLSTQANTMNRAAVQFWQAQGIRRVILPRELSIPEIRDIHDAVPDIELEVFAHGAMCVAYAGRCLLSGYLTHRDANLGICTNSCRWAYRLWGRNTAEEFPSCADTGAPEPQPAAGYALEELSRPGELFPIEEDEHGTYILNSHDLCAVEYLADLGQAGVTGFKIEGRTKSVYYLALIGRAYRQALDDVMAERPISPEVLTDIRATSNRGLIPGFLIRLPDERRQHYTSGSSAYSTYRFGGIVRRYDADTRLAEIEVKNRLAHGDQFECVSPGGVFAQTVGAMFNLAQQPIAVAHPGAANILLSMERPVEPLTILRTCL
jgi:U32 family peptidase